MKVKIPKDVENSINEAVRSGKFSTADEAITAAWLAFSTSRAEEAPPPRTAKEAEAVDQAKPVWERALERAAAIPDEAWEKLPIDGSEQHDHYIYGTPKRPAR